MPDHANPTEISTDENIQLEPTQGFLSKFKSEKPHTGQHICTTCI